MKKAKTAHHLRRSLRSLRCLAAAWLAGGFLLLGGAALHATGTVVVWGGNTQGQRDVPADLGTVTAIACGAQHCLALTPEGKPVGWGDDSLGQAAVPAWVSNVTAISAGFFSSTALRDDGTVVAWGYEGVPPAGLTNVIAVAAGWEHTLGLLRDGSVVAWGMPSDVPAGLPWVVAMAAGYGHSLVLKADTTVSAWGQNAQGQANVPAGLTNIVAIAAGEAHSLALRADGRVFAWGANSSGQTNVPATLTNAVAIAAGAAHSLAITRDGLVVGWGAVDYGQARPPSNLTNVQAVAGGIAHSLAMVGDGRPYITVPPANQFVPVGKDGVFRVMAVGTAPLVYQWQHLGTNLPGATRSSLSLVNVQPGDAGAYSVVVSNLLGTARSGSAILTPVPVPPTVTVPPKDTNTICGEAASFRVTADGSPTYQYQWLFEGTPIVGATNRTLVLPVVTTNNAGLYAAVVANGFGSVTSAPARLGVTVELPAITSALTATGKQGLPFTYTIKGLHFPIAYDALGLPGGLSVNTTNGVIAGTPLENGIFEVLIQAINPCTLDSQVLTLTLTSSVPVITSPLTTNGIEATNFLYQITATESPTSYAVENMPPGLLLDPAKGIISGMPLYGGPFTTTIMASNQWGVGQATLHLNFEWAPLSGLSIADVSYAYSSPYLLDFQFSLRDSEDPAGGHAVVVDPKLLSVVCKEADVAISPRETGSLVQRGSAKLFKAYMVLDFTESIASLSNGDENSDGISDAVDNLVSGANMFVEQMPIDTQVGIYEFHREDFDPMEVTPLTSDRVALSRHINGIWDNYVQWFPAGSRCWDALAAAIPKLGTTNNDEVHCVVFVSDGRDESSINRMTDVITLATNSGVRIYAIGFGAELDPVPLQTITAETKGRYYTASTPAELGWAFGQIGKDFNGQYLLRWATLKRGTNSFMPSFEISYQGYTALSPTNPTYLDLNNPVIDTNTTPATTNYPTLTNIVIGPFTPSQYTGSVTVGSMRLVADAAERPTSVTLRLTYAPRYTQRIRLHYRPNYPCEVALRSNGPGEILAGWTLSQTNDGAGGWWMDLASPVPQSVTNSIPFAVMGNLVTFWMRDLPTPPTNAFSLFEVDNRIYGTNTGHISFVLATNQSFVVPYQILPYGTPVPWLMQYGFTTNFTAAELSDPDNDGVPTWMEYRANTNPRDPTSAFKVRPLARSGPAGHFAITFSTAANRTYRVEWSEDLTTWQTLADNLTGTGADLTVTDTHNPAVDRVLFYRVLAY